MDALSSMFLVGIFIVGGDATVFQPQGVECVQQLRNNKRAELSTGVC